MGDNLAALVEGDVFGAVIGAVLLFNQLIDSSHSD